MSNLSIHFGFNKKGEAVSIPLFQMFFDATTGHGKTVGMKTLLWRFHQAHPEWIILIIDSKDKRDYADLNADIPICFVQTTEPLDLKNLLEPFVGSSMMYYLDKIIEESVFDTLGEIQQSMEKKVLAADEGTLKIPRKELGKLRVLNHLLKKLIVLVERPEITDKLVLKPGLNVMNVSLPGVPLRLKRAFQWLILRSVLLKLTEPKWEKVLTVLDEFHKWSPQKWASLVKQQMSENVSEGRGKENFYWMADQALAKVDKDPLKPVKVWIVGQQMGRHEIKYAVETVNDTTELEVDKKDIKGLHIGHFLIVDGINHIVHQAYLQPYGVPNEVAREIAMGKRPSSAAERYISDFNFVSKIEEDEDLVYKEKYEEEHRIRKELEKALGEYSENLKTLQDKIKHLESTLKAAGKSKEEIEKPLLKQIEVLKEEKTDIFKELDKIRKDQAKLKEKAEAFEKLQKALEPLIPTKINSSQAPGITKKTLNLDHVELITNVSHSEETTRLSTKTQQGQIMYCAIHDLKGEEFTEKEMSEALIEHGWEIPHSSLAPQLASNLRKQGLLIKIPKVRPTRYRLPSKRTINIIID